MAWHLLLVEDEESVREAFALRLMDHGYLVQTAGSGEEALALLRSFEPDILVLDLVMPNLSGLDVLARVKQTFPHLPVILLTARGTVKDAVEATKLGTFDFVAKSIDMEDLQHALTRATKFLTLQRQVHLQMGQEAARYALDRVIAKSPITQGLLGQIRDSAKNDRVTVLLQGETGKWASSTWPGSSTIAVPAPTSPISKSTARRSRATSSRVNCSATRRARSPVRPAGRAG